MGKDRVRETVCCQEIVAFYCKKVSKWCNHQRSECNVKITSLQISMPEYLRLVTLYICSFCLYKSSRYGCILLNKWIKYKLKVYFTQVSLCRIQKIRFLITQWKSMDTQLIKWSANTEAFFKIIFSSRAWANYDTDFIFRWNIPLRQIFEIHWKMLENRTQKERTSKSNNLCIKTRFCNTDATET